MVTGEYNFKDTLAAVSVNVDRSEVKLRATGENGAFVCFHLLCFVSQNKTTLQLV